MLIILDKIQIKSYVHIIHNHLPHKHNVYTIAPPLNPLLVMSEKEVPGLGLGLGGGGGPYWRRSSWWSTGGGLSGMVERVPAVR